MITKPEDAVPTNAIHRIYEGLDGFTDQVRSMFTAAECAEIAKAYGNIVLFTRKVHFALITSKQASKRRRRLYSLWNRCILARQAWENKFEGWEAIG